MASTKRDVAKEAFWRGAIARQGESGLSVRGFCRVEQLAEHSFHAWRRTIRLRDDAVTPPAFVPAVISEVRSLDESIVDELPIVLELTSGLALKLPSILPLRRIAELVQALEGRPQ